MPKTNWDLEWIQSEIEASPRAHDRPTAKEQHL